MKKNKKTRRQELLEDRFTDLAVERKSDIEVPKSLSETVFQTLEEIENAEEPQELIPTVQDKIVELFKDERL